MRTISRILAALATAILVASFAVPMAAAQGDDNRGTIKVHDDEDADPDVRNEPHVSCDFWIEGFNMKDPSGHLTFYTWPPTGNKSVITPGGDDLSWNGTADGDGEWDFLKGAYYLPEGHYRVEAFTDDGHPGHDSGHFAKAKMFWVDPCEEEPPCVDDPDTQIDDCNPPPCVDNEQTPEDECDEEPPCEDVPATEIDECEPEIPFFPGFTSLAMGSLAALGAAGYILRNRRS